MPRGSPAGDRAGSGGCHRRRRHGHRDARPGPRRRRAPQPKPPASPTTRQAWSSASSARRRSRRRNCCTRSASRRISRLPGSRQRFRLQGRLRQRPDKPRSRAPGAWSQRRAGRLGPPAAAHVCASSDSRRSITTGHLVLAITCRPAPVRPACVRGPARVPAAPALRRTRARSRSAGRRPRARPAP